MEDRAGADYVIYRGPTQEIGRGSLPLGNSSEVYDAEIAGATEGLAAAIRNPLAYYASNVTVCLGNQEAAIRLLLDTPKASSSAKIFNFRKLAVNRRRRPCGQNTSPREVAVLWCLGLAGIFGNEVADALAKAACAAPALHSELSVAKIYSLSEQSYAAL